jgi:hypothetical protein
METNHKLQLLQKEENELLQEKARIDLDIDENKNCPLILFDLITLNRRKTRIDHLIKTNLLKQNKLLSAIEINGFFQVI